MLLRISLVLAILLGIGTIVYTQKMARENIQRVITVRDENIQGRAKEKGRADKAEKDLASTRTTLTQTSNTLVKTEEELNGTRQQLTATQESLNKNKADLAKAIEERKTAQAELAKWEQIGPKPEQIREMMASVKKQQDAIAALEDEKKILNRRVTELDNRIKTLLDVDYEVQLPSGTKGSIVAVDPKWNFVVLDIGVDKGVLPGGVMLVHRNTHLVGKVRVNEVMPNRSIASMLPGWKLGDVEEGDQVLSKN